MLVREVLGHAGRHDSVHHWIGHLEHCHGAAELARRRGRFEADVAAPYDDDPGARLEPRPDRAHVGHAAQVMHAGERGARAGKLPGPCPGTHQEPVNGSSSPSDRLTRRVLGSMRMARRPIWSSTRCWS